MTIQKQRTCKRNDRSLAGLLNGDALTSLSTRTATARCPGTGKTLRHAGMLRYFGPTEPTVEVQVAGPRVMSLGSRARKLVAPACAARATSTPRAARAAGRPRRSLTGDMGVRDWLELPRHSTRRRGGVGLCVEAMRLVLDVDRRSTNATIILLRNSRSVRHSAGTGDGCSGEEAHWDPRDAATRGGGDDRHD
jgi:hypothetical protein